MKFDLDKMGKDDLEKLRDDVDQLLQDLREQELKSVRAEMEKLAAAHGLSVDDVFGGKRGGKKGPSSKSAPKFANPEDKTQTWTGKGRQPEWFKSAIAAGASPDSMAI